jgi:hypothetical protein
MIDCGADRAGHTVISFFACMVQLARAYHRQTYKYLPLLEPLLKTLDEKLGEWYIANQVRFDA